MVPVKCGHIFILKNKTVVSLRQDSDLQGIFSHLGILGPGPLPGEEFLLSKGNVL
jgi:hypothetical protein